MYTHIQPIIQHSEREYGIGNQGFVRISKKQYSCTITDGPQEYDAIKLQSTSFEDSSTFRVRRQDITKVIENQNLLNQRVAFELVGSNDRYHVVEISNKKQIFLKCFWSNDYKETWLHKDNFHTRRTSVSQTSTSSSINGEISASLSLTPTPNEKNKNNINNNSLSPSMSLMNPTTPESDGDDIDINTINGMYNKYMYLNKN